MTAFFNRYFKFDELQTNLRTEIIAGLSTYLSLAYTLGGRRGFFQLKSHEKHRTNN
jgi:hypothetical protein